MTDPDPDSPLTPAGRELYARQAANDRRSRRGWWPLLAALALLALSAAAVIADCF